MTIVLAAGLFVLAAITQMWVAADPVIHVLVQFPLLGLCGYLLGRDRFIPGHWAGSALALAIFFFLFWMLPRSIDDALAHWQIHVMKFITLPLGTGLPLALSWKYLPPVLKGFLKAQCITMFGILGFLYTHAPVRICNSYLLDDQIRLGYGFFYLACGLSVFWTIPVFTGRQFRASPALQGTHLS